MTQLVPDDWNEWPIPARQSWWFDHEELPAYMPFIEEDKLPGEDAWINPHSGAKWELDPNPWHPGKYRWKTTQNHGWYSIKNVDPRHAVHEWAKRRSEEMRHAERDSVKSLRRAEKIITGDRYNDYGPPEENFERIATYWNQYLKDNPPPLKPSDTAMLMVFVKIAREAAGHKTDSVVDAEGYLAIYEELRNKEILDEETGTELYGGN
jgi:hypothetical protein